MKYEAANFWIAVTSAATALASLFVSLVATRVAKSALVIADSSLAQAKEVADRELRDWRQMKWFDLYFAASEFRDSLEHFQARYDAASVGTVNFVKDRNDLMFLFRRVASMAMVFPQHPAIDALASSAKGFREPAQSLSAERLAIVDDAVEGLRQKALVNPAVLG